MHSRSRVYIGKSCLNYVLVLQNYNCDYDYVFCFPSMVFHVKSFVLGRESSSTVAFSVSGASNTSWIGSAMDTRSSSTSSAQPTPKNQSFSNCLFSLL